MPRTSRDLCIHQESLQQGHLQAAGQIALIHSASSIYRTKAAAQADVPRCIFSFQRHIQ